ncbi:MAG: hypothetical protein AB1689_03925 [Thermodesulfobacteriota bacterium]
MSARLAAAFTVAGTLAMPRPAARARAAGADAVHVSLPSYAPAVTIPLLEALIA